MKKTNKLLSIFGIILMLTLTTLAATVPSASAQAQITGTSASYSFLAVNPNPIGVGQQAQVSLFMWIPPPTATATGGDRWQGMTVTITKPDGSTENKGPYHSDAVGGAFFTYTPTSIGVYKFQMHFPGQRIVGLAQIIFGPPSPMDVQFQPSDSYVVELNVQNTQAPQPQIPPLPSSYWTRPINAQNEAWDSISNSWLMPAWDSTNRQFDQGSVYVPVATAPTTAHVMWTKPLTFGGLIGGEYGTTAFHNGMSYEQFFKPPVVIGGRLYYNTIQAEEPTNTGGGAAGGVDAISASTITAVDLATGQEVFQIAGARLDFGQIYNFISPNQGGGLAYLWDTSGGSTWRMFDAWTGNYILSVANVSAGTILLDNTFNVNRGRGDILIYSLDPVGGTLSLWNSSQIFATLSAPLPGPTNNILTWRIYNWQGQTVDGNLGKMWTKPLANFPAGGSIAQVGYDGTVYVVAGQTQDVLGATAAFSFPQKSTWAGYSMTDASKLWGPNVIDATSKIPPNGTTFPGTFLQTRVVGIGADKGILALFVKDTLQWYAWNVTSGAFLWGPTQPYTNPWGLYNYESQLIANGVLYNAGYDGLIHAFNARDGTKLWEFYSGSSGTVTPYGTWPFYNGITVTKNAVIGTTGEHGNGVQPLYLGEGIYVVNPDTGKQIWNMTGWFTQPVIADGMMVSHNLYDNQIYAFGKGPSAITISAPVTAVAPGTSMVIQGSVTDQSPGKPGTPAISDADQAAWMNYLYEQQPQPNHATGVPVTLIATGPDGVHTTIGTVTSDATGHYAASWTSNGQGLYTIAAVFSGTNSYWGSTAEASVVIGSAPNPSPGTPSPSTPEVPPGGVSSSTLYLIVAAIVIIIIVVAAAALLRRRK